MASILSVAALEQRGATLVAETETHFLFVLPECGSGDWGSFYLRLVGLPDNRNTKRSWWLSHNGDRIGHNRDAAKLFADDWQTYEWVTGEMSSWVQSNRKG